MEVMKISRRRALAAITSFTAATTALVAWGRGAGNARPETNPANSTLPRLREEGRAVKTSQPNLPYRKGGA